jgi:hypothetical protein
MFAATAHLLSRALDDLRFNLRAAHDAPTTYGNRKAKLGRTSLAGFHHDHQREIARRARQLTRIAENRRARGICPRLGDFRPEGVAGYTRRGRAVNDAGQLLAA